MIPIRYFLYLAIFIFIANIAFLFKYFTSLNTNKNHLLSNDVSNIYEDNLADLKHFKYLISKSECIFEDPIEVPPLFVLAVNSNPINKEMRQTIRCTWGQYHKGAKTYFFLGATESDQIQQDLVAEDEEFGDIIQGNFIDDKHHLAYKHIMMLKWFTENCALAEYMIKLDDDVFAHVPAIYDFLFDNYATTNFLMGIYHEPEHCPRDGPDLITRDEYASDFYPSYAERHFIIYSRDVVAELLHETQLVEFFWVEDVFVTGILRSQINVNIISIQNYLLTDESLDDMRETSINLPHPPNFMLSKSNMGIEDQLLLWERTEWYRLGEKQQL